MYMVPTHRQRPKLEPRFFRGTWLGKCTSTGEPFVGVAGRLVRARIVRRLPGEARYDKQMLGTVKGTPWNPSPPLGFQPSFLLPPLPALSSAESEFFAIGTGETEALHLKNFRGEILTNKINLRIHTDSSSGKSMATRIGVSKRAKHIELRYMFIQHLIHDGILAIHKINTKHNPADILTKYVTREVLLALVPSAYVRQRAEERCSCNIFTTVAEERYSYKVSTE